MSKRKPAARFLTLTLSPWVYVTIIVLLIGPFSVAVVYSDQIVDAYVRAYVGPEVQDQFGFRMERKRMYYRQVQSLDVFVITAIEPDGVLARAGVKNGDVPLSSIHMSDVDFYRRLRRSKKEAIKQIVIGCDEYEDWLKTGKSSLYDRARKVVIPQVN
jgi:hypothetical protein